MSPENPKNFDVIVIGAGPAGEVLAGRLAEAGQSVAIVEAELVGGECSYYACMPSKALLRPAQAIAEARRVPGAAQAVSGTVDVEAVLARRDEMIHDLDDSGQVPWLEADGLAEARPWTNREITTTKTVPLRLIILGGGVVAVEMASASRSLGSDVVLIGRGDRLVERVEPFASQELLESLRERGVDVRLDLEAARVTRTGATVHVVGHRRAGHRRRVIPRRAIGSRRPPAA